MDLITFAHSCAWRIYVPWKGGIKFIVHNFQPSLLPEKQEVCAGLGSKHIQHETCDQKRYKVVCCFWQIFIDDSPKSQWLFTECIALFCVNSRTIFQNVKLKNQVFPSFLHTFYNSSPCHSLCECMRGTSNSTTSIVGL